MKTLCHHTSSCAIVNHPNRQKQAQTATKPPRFINLEKKNTESAFAAEK